ncbi:hypothetical protein RhiJN_14812 [Ceratobasidium sp. AG-Ba]|nr:hypothetical protein RhiJN_14812 [Ceratobasidium sp. AG-Ba]
MSPNCTVSLNLDPGIISLEIRLGVFATIVCAVLLAILGVFEAGREQCDAEQDLPSHLQNCILRVRNIATLLSLTGIAITIAAYVQAVQTAKSHKCSDKTFTLFHAYITLALLTVISIAGTWSLVHCQLLYMSIKRSPPRFQSWWSRFVHLHMKWTFKWWCHQTQLLLMGAFGLYIAIEFDNIPQPLVVKHHWVYGKATRRAAFALYGLLLVPIFNNIIFGLPSFLLAVAGANIYLAQSHEKPWSLLHTPDVDVFTIYRVIMGVWGAGTVLLVTVSVTLIEVTNGITFEILKPPKKQDWDFGDTYALVLVIIPLQSIVENVFNILQLKRPGPRVPFFSRSQNRVA